MFLRSPSCIGYAGAVLALHEELPEMSSETVSRIAGGHVDTNIGSCLKNFLFGSMGERGASILSSSLDRSRNKSEPNTTRQEWKQPTASMHGSGGNEIRAQRRTTGAIKLANNTNCELFANTLTKVGHEASLTRPCQYVQHKFVLETSTFFREESHRNMQM